MFERGRRIVVDGTIATRPAHGWAVPVKLCRSAARRLPTATEWQSQCQPDARSPGLEHQGASEEQVPKALPVLLQCDVT
jgi:hypothetical protein